MRILSLLIFCLFLLSANRLTDSPHGPEFKISCTVCHSSGGWQLDKAIYSFDHNTTKLPLTGQHKVINCRQCHPTLVFSEAKNECNQCHQDVHQATTGSDCSRCHSAASWLVGNIIEIHQISRFPLIGPHRSADCYECHKAENPVRFDIPGINCIDCHRSVYIATTSPNHEQAQFSEDCYQCHPANALQWGGAGFNHNFFTLSGGHATIQCADCHINVLYSDIYRECFACHEKDFPTALNPDHVLSGFPKTCQDCHTLTPGWKPASYKQHDSESFPIYSGKHEGEWNSCTDCHENASNYSVFTCINCHEHNKSDMDRKHSGEVRNYSYNSSECFRCHRDGKSD